MSLVVTLPQTPGPNSALIAVIGLTDSGGAGEVTSIAQGAATWQLAKRNNNGDERSEIWYSLDAQGETTTVTITTVSDQDEKAVVMEWFGVFEDGGSALDRSAGSGGSSNPIGVGPTIETSKAEELFIAGLMARGIRTFTSSGSGGFGIEQQESGAGVNDVSLSVNTKIVTLVEEAICANNIGTATDFGGALATFFAAPPANVIFITGVDRAEVPEDGGHRIDIEGDFSEFLGTELEVFIGVNGDDTDAPCYSGVVGRAHKAIPLSSTLLRVYTPRLDVGLQGIYIQGPLGVATGALPNSITAHKRGFETSVYDLRKVSPPYYLTGPRSITGEDF